MRCGRAGRCCVVGHHPDGLPPWRSLSDEDSHAEEQSHSHGGDGHANSGMFFTAEQAAAELGITPPGWHVDVAASRERQATGPDGQSATLADAVLRATRLHPPT